MEGWQLTQMRGLPLEIKIAKSKLRLREWLDHWDREVYVSFSGGKDSTVLLHLARQVYPRIPVVFLDSGLEYPETRSFVKQIPDVTWIRPEKPFLKIIQDVGYPIPNKEQAAFIQEYRDTKSEKLRRIRWEGNKWGRGKISKKWRFLVDAPFRISDKCCDYIKKRPFAKYERETGQKMITGEMTHDSAQRYMYWLKEGCNAFQRNRPKSTPLAFWTDEDIWTYISQENLAYSPIYDMGYERTGCTFCMFGIATETPPNRFEKMKKTHPNLYKYCMEILGLEEILSYAEIPH